MARNRDARDAFTRAQGARIAANATSGQPHPGNSGLGYLLDRAFYL
jgi:hypothetical protein